MRANVALGLLISTLKKHDVDAPLPLDDPHLRELITHLRENLLEAQTNPAVSKAMVPPNEVFAQSTRLLNAGSLSTLLSDLNKVDMLLREAGKHH
ncbi:hypothetical protein HX776_11770 [Pseudomonas agarici]|nr:hypothetical protein [Pseudomonas agarici]